MSKPLHRLETFHETIGAAISRSRDLDAGLQRCTEVMVEQLGLALARIWVFQPAEDVLELRASAGTDPPPPDGWSRVRSGEGAVGKVAAERAAHHTDSIETDPVVGGRPWCAEHGIVSLTALPLLIEDRLVGVVAMFARAPLTAVSITALHSVADAIALGIERKRVEGALERNRILFEAVTEQAGEGIAIADAEGRFLLGNPAFCRMTGYGREEVLGLDITDLLPDGVPPRVHPRALEGKSERRVVSIVRKDGDRFEAEISGYPLDISGERLVLAIIRDVTRELEAEERYRRLEEQLRLSQRMESIGQLAGGVAHDFNNLLLVILGHAELATDQMSEESAGVLESLDEIKAAAESASVLTRQLLAFSRRQPLEIEILDLDELVHGLLRMLRRLIPESYEIEFSPGEDLGRIEADAGQLEQVLLNLVINARDAMDVKDGPGRLSIATANATVDEEFRERHPWATPGSYVSLVVTDTGIGMSAELAERIFDPFFTTKETGHGTGMGLATVYGIVKQHDGMILCESQPGEGATFRIYFPRTDVREKAKQRCARPDAAAGEGTILVAEDDESVRKMVSGVLRQVGYQVLEAVDGAEALQLFGENQEEVDLVLLDAVMPKLNGLEVFQRIREWRPEVRVLFTSGYSPRRIPPQLFEDERLSLLLKPFGPADLLREVHRAIAV